MLVSLFVLLVFDCLWFGLNALGLGYGCAVFCLFCILFGFVSMMLLGFVCDLLFSGAWL